MTPIRCSTFPPSRALTPSAPRMSRPPSTRCSPKPAPQSAAWRRMPRRLVGRRRRAHRRALDRLDRAWSAVAHLNAVVTRPSCATPTTPTCRRSPRSTPTWRRTCGCMPGTARCATALHRRARSRAAHADRQRTARLQAGRRRTADRDKARLQGGERGAGGPLDAVRRKRARRDQRVGALRRRRGRTRRRARRRRWPRRGRRPTPTASRAGSSRCSMPCYLPVMQYADNRALRAACIAPMRRARPSWAPIPSGTTAPIIERILRCATRRRSCSATRNFAEVSLVPKMARDPDEVLAFLRDLGTRAKPFARARLGRAATFARASSVSTTSRRGTSRTRPRG